ncbi:hypothetical protein pipiens_019876 [Culex pipiens pipiens]|uniref:Carboxylic ester hydrolase n=1 Tax=Culex pipiens pipiens TaxID=38569 RepID=A0ABD1DQP8_CULPP
MLDPVSKTLLATLLATGAIVAASSSGNVFPQLPIVLPTPLVCIEDGCLIGTTRDALEGSQFDAFFGVPYAKPPVGQLRFRDPVEVEPWDGNYDASFERGKCVQKSDARPMSLVEGGEDCLYLNLYRPQNVREKLPVIFYIHGGSYASGSASFAEYGPERLMDTGKVIVVVIQYRLGVFGFLSTDDSSSPGNYGLKDQSMALRWVQRNIERFGGDPNRVTLVGQSAGGAAVQMHMMSRLSQVAERHLTNGSFLNEEPRALWAAGKYLQVPWITGTVPNDGAADSLGIVTNATLLYELNEKSRAYIPRLAGGVDNADTTPMLKDRFFPDGTDERWLTTHNFLNLQEVSKGVLD